MQHFVKVFGERCTGTRAFMRMLEAQNGVVTRPVDSNAVLDLPENAALLAQIKREYSGQWKFLYLDALHGMEFANVRPSASWKHGAVRWDNSFAEDSAHVVFCVRNPYSWVISLAKEPYHIFGPKPGTIEAFVARPWMTMERDKTAAVLASPMELWNLKNRAFHAFAQAATVPVQILKFEEFVTDAPACVAAVLDGFDIPHGKVSEIETSTKDGRTLREISEYYANEGWRDHLTEGLVEVLNAQIDWEVAEFYGYTKLKPADFPRKAISKNSSRSRSWMSRLGFR